MRRLLATTTLSLAFIAAPACDKKEEEKKDTTAKKAEKGKADADKGKAGADKEKAAAGGDAGKAGGDADKAGSDTPAPAAAAAGALIDYAPDATKVLAVINLEGLVGSAMYKGQEAAIEASPIGKNLVAAKACNLGMETWKELVIAGDPDGKDAVMMAMGATGIGKKENIECIAGKYKEQDPKVDWKIEDKDGRTVVSIDGGDALVYAVSDDALVMTSKSWDAAVQERIGGKGTGAASGSLKDALALADATKHIYLAGMANADMAQGPLAGAKAFGAALDVSSGLGLTAAVSFADADSATKQAAAINGQFNGVKGMAPGFGVPQGLIDSVKIEAKDATVAFSAKATEKEVEELGKAAAGMMLSGGPR